MTYNVFSGTLNPTQSIKLSTVLVPSTDGGWEAELIGVVA